jgi:hypothetical protein
VMLDPDVVAKAKKAATKVGKPFEEIINTALRIWRRSSSNADGNETLSDQAETNGPTSGLQL